jgi:hypothetical protein
MNVQCQKRSSLICRSTLHIAFTLVTFVDEEKVSPYHRASDKIRSRMTADSRNRCKGPNTCTRALVARLAADHSTLHTNVWDTWVLKKGINGTAHLLHDRLPQNTLKCPPPPPTTTTAAPPPTDRPAALGTTCPSHPLVLPILQPSKPQTWVKPQTTIKILK